MKLVSATILSLALQFSLSDKAFAYGEETHKQETDVMLLYTGLHEAIADKLSTYAQWVDTSKMNSALNPIPLGHMRVSRLLHFPTQGASPFQILISKVTDLIGSKEAGHGNIQHLLNVAQRDSMIANEIFNEALKTGNAALIGAALHVLMDSYAHEGFNYIIGHGDRGHYPDRPWMFIEKHNEMRKKLFQAMVRIREVLPANALKDIQVSNSGKKNKDMTADELYEAYVNDSRIMEMDASNPHLNLLYKAEAIGLVINKMIKEGTANENLREYIFTNLREEFEKTNPDGSQKDAWQLVQEIINHVHSLDPAQRDQLIDTKKVLEIYGNLADVTLKNGKGEKIVITVQERMANVDMEKVKDNMVKELCSRIIPRPALGDHDTQAGAKVSFENEHLNGKVEAAIQKAKWQVIRQKMFGLAPVVLDESRLISKVFTFMKNDSQRLVEDIQKMEVAVRRTTLTAGERAKFMWALFKYTILDYASYRLSYPLFKLKLIEKPFGNLRLTDDDVLDAKLWQDDALFKRLLESKVFKSFHSEEQVGKLISKWEIADRKFSEALAKANALRPLGDGDIEIDPAKALEKRTEGFMTKSAQKQEARQGLEVGKKGFIEKATQAIGMKGAGLSCHGVHN